MKIENLYHSDRMCEITAMSNRDNCALQVISLREKTHTSLTNKPTMSHPKCLINSGRGTKEF